MKKIILFSLALAFAFSVNFAFAQEKTIINLKTNEQLLEEYNKQEVSDVPQIKQEPLIYATLDSVKVKLGKLPNERGYGWKRFTETFASWFKFGAKKTEYKTTLALKRIQEGAVMVQKNDQAGISKAFNEYEKIFKNAKISSSEQLENLEMQIRDLMIDKNAASNLQLKQAHELTKVNFEKSWSAK